MHSVLVVEDDARICEELCVLLGSNGYEAHALDAFDALADRIIDASCDLVLLDLNLPGVDGMYACRELRRRSSAPVIVLTSRETDVDELMSLSLGADDFVPKSKSDQLLLAHIEAVLKRAYGEGSGSQIQHGGVILDTARCQVSFGGVSVDLTKNELKILTVLMRSAGSVVSRQRLMEELWATDEFVDDNTLSVNVSHLRATLASIGARDFIATKRGMGYMVE